MMKYKVRIAVFFLAALILSTLSGCQLAQEDSISTTEDRLIGVFLTTDYLDLFDFEGYLNNSNRSFSGGEIQVDGSTDKYQGRLNAELRPKTLINQETGEKSETEEYVFPGVKGISYFSANISATTGRESYVSAGSDEAISDGHTSLNYSDQGNTITLDGTVYISPGMNNTYYVNPVYQSIDGQVYALSGNGISMDGVQSEGANYSQILDASYTSTENRNTKKDSFSVKISFSVMFPPEKVTILQMDADSTVISRKEYAPGEIQTSITPKENAEYIVVETLKTDTSDNALITRKLYGRDADSLDTFYCREDGVCIKKWVQLKWKK
ncbi:hypothetical protein QA584_07865 [Anaerocolumna sp. AGMB13025]|uniref:hypothetical protein n=1 Tax=Anaerocolumna sp. AGMB13025 TaxID=3039116 RepID=UPI00241F872C|nr:hypothetical protein [Anaerocolumna sp. AGMB13025]WFR58985.1 hypothetical protein QA584_07865 [Anaerocolumna sp. AGMB13025]